MLAVATSARRTAISAVSLTAFQIVGMALPLLTLPVLARALGVVGFGQVMLAQFVVLFGVVFIDSSLNLESQRRVAAAQDELARTQALLDNLMARALLAVPIASVVLLAGFLIPGLPFWMVLTSLLHMAGTLVFVQWWFVARDEGLRMGVAMTVGRVVSAAVVLVWVRSPADAGIALVAAASASLLSGLLLLPTFKGRVVAHALMLDWRGYRRYLADVRPALVSGFVASSAQSVPAVVLGAIGGTQQVGIFSAADRLTRASAYVAGVAGLSLLNVATRAHAAGGAADSPKIRAILRGAALACGLASMGLVVTAAPVIHLLYGEHFNASVPILQWLAVWLGMHAFRVLKFTLQWKALGCQSQIARLQWQEGLVVMLLSGAGAWLGGAAGVAVGLVVSEACLLLGLQWAGLRQSGVTQ